MKRSTVRSLNLLTLAALAVCASGAPPAKVQVVLELVQAENPDQLVADHFGAMTGTLTWEARLWPKNVRLDGKFVFERYYRDKIILREPRVKSSLAPGKHTISPGDHVFEIRPDGSVATDDPELIVRGKTVKIKCYPVTLGAYRLDRAEASLNIKHRLIATRRLAIGLDDAPKTAAEQPRSRWGARPKGFLDLISTYSVKFQPLTLYLPATGEGKPYRVLPGEFQLSVMPKGLKVHGVGPADLRDFVIRGHEVYIPYRRYSVIGRTLDSRACQAMIPSADELYTGEEGPEGGSFGVGAGALVAETNPATKMPWPRTGVISRTQPVRLTFFAKGHHFLAGDRVKPKDRYLKISGSLGDWPEKTFCYDNTHPANSEPRMLIVERKRAAFPRGRPTELRVQWLDAVGTPTLPKGKVLFFLRPYRLNVPGANPWRQAEAAGGKDHVFAVTPPADLPPGAYSLRTTVCDADRPDPTTSFAIDAVVAVTDPAAAGALGLFTQKGRDAFVCGEDFYLGLAIKTARPIPPGAAVELDVTDPFGKTWPLARDRTPREIRSADAMHFRLSGEFTARLAPGSYRVVAKAAGLAPARRTLHLVSPRKPTHFVNAVVGLGGWGAMLDASRDGLWQADRLGADLARVGVNRLVWSRTGSPVGRYYRQSPELQVERLHRDNPTLPHWQSVYFPTGRERVLNSFVRHGIDLALTLFPYYDDGQPSHLPHIIGSQRFTALQMQAMRHSPAALGFSAFSTRQSTPGSHWPPGMLNVHMRALQERFLKRYGYSTGDASRARERFLRLPPDQRKKKDLQKYRPLGEWSDFHYDDFVRRTTEAANKVATGFANTTRVRTFAAINGTLTGAGYAPTMSKELDWVFSTNDKIGAGFGSAVLYTPHATDVLRVRPDVEVVPAITRAGGVATTQVLTKQLFGGLSQDVDGIASFGFGHDFQAGGGQLRGDRDLLQDVYRDLLTPYGDWLRSLDRGYRKVAIYYSRQAEMLAGAKHVNPSHQAEGLWVACMRAGFPADYLRDEQLLAGEGENYKVIFVPGFTIAHEAPDNLRAALEDLVRKGHVVLVGKRSKLDIDGLTRLNHGLDGLSLYSHERFWFPGHWDADWVLVEKLTEEMTALLKRELPKHVPPATVSDLKISPDWLARGRLSVMVVPNFEHPDFSYEHIAQFHKPYVRKIAFPTRTGVCYDVLENTLVPVTVQGDRSAIEADVRHYGGKLYAFLPEKIGGVSLRAAGSAGAGQAIVYEIAVLDARGRTFDASFPVRIDIIAPDGKTAETVYRAAAPKVAGRYVPGFNAPQGAWRVRARELISGRAAEAVVEVGPPALPAPLRADRATIWAADVPAIRAFLEAGKEIVIPLETDQQWIRPEAKRLAAGLAAKGIRARVADADAVVLPIGDDGLDAYHSWRGEIWPPERKVEHPAIAIGKRRESRLLEDLFEYSVLADVASDVHPGPGRALIQYAWNAFSVEHDTLCVSVSDAAGLRAAVDWLLKIPAGEAGKTYKPKIAAAPPAKAPLKAGRPAPTVRRSFRALYSREDEIQQLALDPATGRVVVGTKGWGHNVFCLDAAGKRLWSRYLPEHNVHRVSFSPDGRKVIAGVGMPAKIYVLDAADGKVLFRFDASEYPQHRFRNTDEQDGFPFFTNPKSGDIYAWGKTGVMAVGLDGEKRWFLDRWDVMQKIPKEVIQEGSIGVDFGRAIRNFVLSPDGRTVALLEDVKEASIESYASGSRVMVPISRAEVMLFDAATLKPVRTHVDKRLYVFGSKPGRLRWREDSQAVVLSRAGASWAIPLRGAVAAASQAGAGKRGQARPLRSRASSRLPAGEAGFPLRLELEQTPGTSPSATRRVHCLDAAGERVWSRDPLPIVQWVPSQDAKTLYAVDLYGTLHALEAATGKARWTRPLGNKGVLAPLPDGGVLFGGLNGMVCRFNSAGQAKHQVLLRDLHEVPGDYDAFVSRTRAGIRDISTLLYPSREDREGDLKGIVRFGLNVVRDGSFEEAGSWKLPLKGASLVAGRTGKRAAQTRGGTVTQEIDTSVIPNATYLLEFHYRPAAAGDVLLAGAFGEGGRDVLTAMRFTGRPGEWRFGRLAVKSFSDTTKFTVGFEALAGQVDVDDVRMRAVRFASRNFLFSAAAHALQPRFVDDLSTTKRGMPRSLEAELIKTDHVTWYVPGKLIGSRGEPLESMALLQNGQLDDVGKRWHTQPDPIGLNVALARPRTVSHVVLYFSHQFPGEAWPRFQIKVNDVKAKSYVTVAAARGNRQHFCVIKFNPILTDLIYILPVGGITQWDATVTEIDVYGPLGGPQTVSGPPKDPGAMPMFMGAAHHVRPSASIDLSAPSGDLRYPMKANDFVASGIPAFADDKVYVGSRAGTVGIWSADPRGRGKNLALGQTGGVSVLGTPALYSARMLVPSADGTLYCFAASDASLQWKYKTGGRMHASPLPDGDDVYAAGDDGKLYKLDLESGMLLWEFATKDKIRASPALAGGKVFAVSWDGHCYAVWARSGKEVWRAPLAKYSLSSPAVAAGRVFVGDEDGVGWCLDAASGKKQWTVKLDGPISAAPTVLDSLVVFAAENGRLVAVGRSDGKPKWRHAGPDEISAAPIPTSSGLLVVGAKRTDLLDPANGARKKSFAIPGRNGVTPYRGRLYFFEPSRWYSFMRILQPTAPRGKAGKK